ncbi:MAG: hypothetical protein E7348_04480 [Clostridiales bacterium]|nr:hypothetical protein [Clostridiales bacterium]
MKDFLSKINKDLISPVVYTVVGILFCIFGIDLARWVLAIAGIALFVFGVLDCGDGEYKSGAFKIALGLVCGVGGWFITNVILTIIGAFLLAFGVCEFVPSYREKDIYLCIINGATALFAIMMLLDVFLPLAWIYIVLGAVLTIKGVFMIVEHFYEK